MRSQKSLEKKVVANVSRRGNLPRKQKRGKKSSASTEAAVQQLASVVAQQHVMLKTIKESKLGPALLMREGRSDLGDLGDGVDRSIRAIRRMLNVEKKCFQAAGANITTSTTGTVTDFLSGIAQGVTDITRVGDSIKVLRLTMNYLFEMNSTAAATQALWVTIIRAHDEIMTAAQLNTLDASAFAYLGDYPWDYKDQFEVLWERRIVVDPEHQASLGRVDLKLDHHCQYNAGGNTVNSGSIFMVTWSTATANNPIFGYVLGVEFVDN